MLERQIEIGSNVDDYGVSRGLPESRTHKELELRRRAAARVLVNCFCHGFK